MTPQMIMEHINHTFDEAVFVTDVGQNQMWATQYLDIDEKRQMITSGGLGTMGFGFPAAIGAKIGNRDTEVVCVTGDGGFQMNSILAWSARCSSFFMANAIPQYA